MVREILFRGKQAGWVTGGFKRYEDGRCVIITEIEEFEVIPESVVQFTGLKDKKGVQIWEGDIVKFYHKGSYVACEIIWNKLGMWSLKYKGGYINNYHLVPENFEVVGNMFDNPKLLK